MRYYDQERQRLAYRSPEHSFSLGGKDKVLFVSLGKLPVVRVSGPWSSWQGNLENPYLKEYQAVAFCQSRLCLGLQRHYKISRRVR